MATAKEHYDKVLSDLYSWIYGGFEVAIQRNIGFFKKHHLKPEGSGIAIDLGAGCGFQSIPLAKAGYSVTAIDINAKLLNELSNNCEDLPIKIVQDDLSNIDRIAPKGAELVACMTDTILHIDSKPTVISVFDKVFQVLDNKGKFVLTFRDLTHELKGTDRFLPVKSDENTIFTCFLEYESDAVKVHDIIYKKTNGNWELSKSFYKKLRLSENWVTGQLSKCGFKKIKSSIEDGFIIIIANKEPH